MILCRGCSVCPRRPCSLPRESLASPVTTVHDALSARYVADIKTTYTTLSICHAICRCNAVNRLITCTWVSTGSRHTLGTQVPISGPSWKLMNDIKVYILRNYELIFLHRPTPHDVTWVTRHCIWPSCIILSKINKVFSAPSVAHTQCDFR